MAFEISAVSLFEETFKKFDEIVGLNYLQGMHINDSKKELGTRVDRHDSLGKGVMGLDVFSFIVNDCRFDNIPLILETPDDMLWPYEIKMLREMVK